MSKKEWVIEQFCKISEFVGRVKFDHEHSYDCFCGKTECGDSYDYRYDEEVLKFIADAVNEKIAGSDELEKLREENRVLRGNIVAAVKRVKELEAREVEAYMWQHGDSGRIGFIDKWQVENGWQSMNPRLSIVCELVRKESL